jgi:hypothetical protein
LTNTKQFSSLTLNQDEINKFIDNRIKNYAKIMNKFKLTPEYFENIIQYHLQLISTIINENNISFYNPFPENPWDYSPISLGIFQNFELNNVLHDFFIDRIIPYSKIMNKNLSWIILQIKIIGIGCKAGFTSHNRSVCASPPVGGSASIRLGQSLRSFPRLIPAHLGGTKPYGFLYGAAQTSHTAGTLCAIVPKIVGKYIKNGLDKNNEVMFY